MEMSFSTRYPRFYRFICEYWLISTICLCHSILNALWIIQHTAPPAWDESSHFLQTHQILTVFSSGFSFPNLIRFISTQWQYSFLFHCIAALIGSITNESFNAMIAINTVFFCISIVSVYKIGLFLYEKRIALLAAFAFSMSPVVVGMSRIFLTDCTLYTSVILSFYFLLRLYGGFSWKRAHIFAALFFFGILVRPLYLTYISIPILLCLTHIRVKQPAEMRKFFLLLTLYLIFALLLSWARVLSIVEQCKGAKYAYSYLKTNIYGRQLISIKMLVTFIGAAFIFGNTLYVWFQQRKISFSLPWTRYVVIVAIVLSPLTMFLADLINGQILGVRFELLNERFFHVWHSINLANQISPLLSFLFLIATLWFYYKYRQEIHPFMALWIIVPFIVIGLTLHNGRFITPCLPAVFFITIIPLVKSRHLLVRRSIICLFCLFCSLQYAVLSFGFLKGETFFEKTVRSTMAIPNNVIIHAPEHSKTSQKIEKALSVIANEKKVGQMVHLGIFVNSRDFNATTVQLYATLTGHEGIHVIDCTEPAVVPLLEDCFTNDFIMTFSQLGERKHYISEYVDIDKRRNDLHLELRKLLKKGKYKVCYSKPYDKERVLVVLKKAS